MAPPESPPSLLDRHILLGVSGSIAAYKTAPLVRLFKKAGADVQVLMTKDATRFIAPLTLGTLSEREVLTGIFPEEGPGPNARDGWTQHVSLGLWADLFIIAPATAQTIAKLAHGFSDSMLTATALSANCPLLVCPAMDRDMYRHPATQDNIERLRGMGYEVMPAEHGELASGLIGPGRMPEPEAIVARVKTLLGHNPNGSASSSDASPAEASSHFGPLPSLEHRPLMEQEPPAEGAESESPAPPSSNATASFAQPPPASSDAAPSTSKQPLSGHHVLVTAGPTQEPIDPVRVITNRSTGTMGYALARAAATRGARVTLVSGPTCLDTPPGVERVDVMTTKEMHTAVQQHADADLIIMAAAVSDYTPARTALSKIKKEGSDELVLRFRRTTDILKTLGENKRAYQQLVGFALETDDGIDNARRKLEAKNLDWIALNNPLDEGAGFGPTTNRVILLHRNGYKEKLPLADKADVAEMLLDRVAAAGIGAPRMADEQAS